MFMKVIEWLEWILGTIILTYVGVIISLKEFTSYGQWTLIGITVIFFAASFIEKFHKEGLLR